MKKNWKFATMALVASMTLFTTACSDDTPNENGGDGMVTKTAPIHLTRILNQI